MFVNGQPVDQAKLEALLEALELGSLCAHGGGMPAPIRSLLEHWPEELGLA
jgi:NADH-quinone oxidoreductase subunit F